MDYKSFYHFFTFCRTSPSSKEHLSGTAMANRSFFHISYDALRTLSRGFPHFHHAMEKLSPVRENLRNYFAAVRQKPLSYCRMLSSMNGWHMIVTSIA